MRRRGRGRRRRRRGRRRERRRPRRRFRRRRRERRRRRKRARKPERRERGKRGKKVRNVNRILPQIHDGKVSWSSWAVEEMCRRMPGEKALRTDGRTGLPDAHFIRLQQRAVARA